MTWAGFRQTLGNIGNRVKQTISTGGNMLNQAISEGKKIYQKGKEHYENNKETYNGLYNLANDASGGKLGEKVGSIKRKAEELYERGHKKYKDVEGKIRRAGLGKHLDTARQRIGV